MTTTTKAMRRSLYFVFAAAAAVGGATVAALTGLFVPSATAAPDPCAASEVAKTVGSVATSTGSYLDSHPETNQALTPSPSSRPAHNRWALKTYFDANPQAGKDMQQLQQPLVSLSGRCKLPITIPQVLGLMQAAQSQGARCRVCQAGCPAHRLSAFPAPCLPAQPVPASATTRGTGPLPGPATTTTR